MYRFIRKITCVSIMFCSFSAVWAEEKMVGGPYAVNVGHKTATVAWIVETSEVSAGKEAGKAEHVVPVLRSKKVHFSSLEPGTKYFYDIDGSDEGKGSFRTAPAANTVVPFEFVVFGDTRTRHDVHRRVIQAILKYSSPDFVLHTGDLVSNGTDSALWPVFFDIERDLLRKTDFFPSLGNHERNDPQFYDFFDIRTPYYSFDWANAHFIVLNSDIGNAGASDAARESFWMEQTRWLEDELRKSQSADFRFVICHHPPMTAVARRQGDNPQMIALIPMFEKYKLTAGFFGHDHNYQHYLRNGIHYFITGGGGAPLYDVSKPPAGVTKKVVSVENFVTVKVSGKTALVEAIGLDGTPIEVTELNH